MARDLIGLREQAMDRVDRALDKVWPARLGDEYVREMNHAAEQIEKIAAEMEAEGYEKVEQSRTFRYLGNIYSDLEPALGIEMLQKAKKKYQVAESLLKGQSDEFEQAKLNFNYGNTLRLIDPEDIEQLKKAKQLIKASGVYFGKHAPQFLPQVNAALQSVESLLKIAPLALAVKQKTDNMAILQKQLADGGDIHEIAKKIKKLMKQDGGVSGIVGQLQAVMDSMPADQKENEKYAGLQDQMKALARQALGNRKMEPEVKQIWDMLHERLKSEAESGKISEDRVVGLTGLLEDFSRILSGDEKDIHSMLNKLQRMRAFVQDKFEIVHYLSHGLPRPPEGSRAADLVELNWKLRRYLLEEMNWPKKGEDESKEALDLNLRTDRVDKRIYEAGADNTLAGFVEKEELRQLAIGIRNFSARMNTMIARPVWHFAKVAVDSNAVFYTGTTQGQQSVAAVCLRSGLEVMALASGESYASARWKQLQKAIIAIFDLRGADTRRMAGITYELGMAVTIGKPVVVVSEEGQSLPFDLDISPVVLAGEPYVNNALATAVDQAVYFVYQKPKENSSLVTLENVISLYPRPQKDFYADQTLGLLADLRDDPDPLAITRTLSKFFDYLNDDETMLIHPYWPAEYPGAKKFRLFHVMPFRPKWADRVTTITRKVCESASVNYVRGDELDEPNVISSIWKEIAGATHVLVDLTGMNANVAMELGIAHTLGKKLLLVGQGDPEENIFPSVSKFRVLRYDLNQPDEILGDKVMKFLLS